MVAAGTGEGVICVQVVGAAAHAESSVMEAGGFLWTLMLFAPGLSEMQGQLTEPQHAIIAHFYRTGLSEQQQPAIHKTSKQATSTDFHPSNQDKAIELTAAIKKLPF